jgi:hypothetical protein
VVTPYAAVADPAGLVVVLTGGGVEPDYARQVLAVMRQVGVGVVSTAYPWWMQPGNYVEVRHGRLDWYDPAAAGTCPIDLRYTGRIGRLQPLVVYAALANVVGCCHELGHGVFGPTHPDVPGGWKYVMHARQPGHGWTAPQKREGPQIARRFVASYLPKFGWPAMPADAGWRVEPV